MISMDNQSKGEALDGEQDLPEPEDVMRHRIKVDDALNLGPSDSLEADDFADLNFDIPPILPSDPDAARHREIIAGTVPATDLELALTAELDRQVKHNEMLAGECAKLRGFIAKRKQTYKRKRKDENAPRKKLSGYNLFVRERFAKLAKENEDALKSADSGAELKRVPPASNIASSGHAWSLLSAEEKARYNEMAKPDEDRYRKENASYNAPDRYSRKRNKTGYNVFFSQHVLELKQKAGGVPSERGSVARIVGDAWKALSAGEKDEYERQADEQNEMDPVDAPEPPEPLVPTPIIAEGLPPPPPEEHHPRPHPVVEPHMETGGGGPTSPPGGDMPPPVPDMHPPPFPPEYGMHHGPPPPVIHHPPGYDGYYGALPPPYDPYGYPPPPYPPSGIPHGMPPPGVEAMPPYGPPPPSYQGPPHPYV